MESVCLRDFIDREKCTEVLGIANLRQPIYVCLTCNDEKLMCRACKRFSVHHGHDLCSLGLRRLRCENNGHVNQDVPHHNRKGRFCWCGQEFVEGTTMWQCINCEDWFHFECIKEDLDWITPESEGHLACRDCSQDIAECKKDPNASMAIKLSVLLPSDWKPCDCEACAGRLSLLKSDNFVELDDSEDDSEIDKLDGLDKDAVLRTIDGYHELKARLSSFIRSMPPGHVVTPQDIHSMFKTVNCKK
jgi:hypothetical protein